MANLLVTDDLGALIEPLLPKPKQSPKGGGRRGPVGHSRIGALVREAI